MAYVYRHIRLDKNEPFYIGIGSDEKYHRAGERTRRNNLWKKIIAKTDYEIEILIDGVSYDFAKIKEIEFITLYGRIIDNSGTLCNLTMGGEGAKGFIFSEEAKRKSSEKQKGRKFTQEHVEKIRIARIGCKMPKRTKEHQSKLDAYKIGRPLKDSTKEKLRLANIGKVSPRRRKIAQYDLSGNFIKQYDFVLQAAKELGKNHGSISDCANGKNKTAHKFIWKYV